MRRLTIFLVAFNALLFAAPTLAQAPALPLMPGYPITENRPGNVYLPTIWTDGSDSWTAFHFNCGPGSLHTYQESTGLDALYLAAPGCAPRTGWYAPDVFGNFVAAQEQQSYYDENGNYIWNSRIVTTDITTFALNDLSGYTAKYNFHPSIGDTYVAWEKSDMHGAPWEIAFNHIGGNATTQEVLEEVDGTKPSRWPNVWGETITFEVNSKAGDGIGIYDIPSETMSALAGPALGGPRFDVYRYGPHIADGRVAYHVRDVPGRHASSSTIRYMDVANWGVEVTPGFLKGIECEQTSAPRVGGEGGRYILFTGLNCEPDGLNYLFLGDTSTDQVYLVDEVHSEPDMNDTRPFYDILDDMIVYQDYLADKWFKIAKIDESAL